MNVKFRNNFLNYDCYIELIFFLSISLKLLISVGDLKKITFSSKDLTNKKTDNAKVVIINNIKKNLNLTFRPYMFQKLNV